MKRATQPEAATQASIRRHLRIGTVGLVSLFGVAGGWAATTQFSGAVIAPGQLVVDSNVKKVQHPTGGVVGEVRVRDGDRVRAGDIVLRLDETVVKANLAIVSKSLDELNVRLMRLEAERDGATELLIPADLAERQSDPAVIRLLEGESGLFRLRRAARNGQKAQLAERVLQLGDEIAGLEQQIAAKTAEIALIQQELTGVRELYRQKLVSLPRVTQLERDAARLEGERGQLMAAVAQARGRTSEVRLQILQIDQDLRSEVAREIREIQAKVAELVERKVAAQDQLSRIDLRAPQDGVVHQLAVHTVGGVVSPGEPVLLIVPDGDHLSVEARIAPQEVDRVRAGQMAVLRLTAFDQNKTPEVSGEVLRVSPDLSIDQRSGAGFYTVRITLGADAAGRLTDLRLVPGMPVEAFIQTTPRTVLSYLTKPLGDQVRRAFREH